MVGYNRKRRSKKHIIQLLESKQQQKEGKMKYFKRYIKCKKCQEVFGTDYKRTEVCLECERKKRSQK